MPRRVRIYLGILSTGTQGGILDLIGKNKLFSYFCIRNLVYPSYWQPVRAGGC